MGKYLSTLFIISFLLADYSAASADKIINTYRAGKFELLIYASDDGEKIFFKCMNKEYFDIDLRIQISPTNMESTRSLSFNKIIPPMGVSPEPADLFVLVRKEKNKPFYYNFNYKVFMGNPGAVNRGDYKFKFDNNKKLKIANAFFGFGAHEKMTPHAVDFSMPVGSKVYAARSGVVAVIKMDGNKGGPGPEYDKFANFVIIQHDDGTYGKYVHLKYDGVVVRPGDKVGQGTLIGYSGNTGYSTAPHLHFDVSVADGKGGLKTVPWNITTGSGAVTPQKGLTIGD